MNKKFSYINDHENFKEKVKEEEQELRKRIKNFLETKKGQKYLIDLVKSDDKLMDLIKPYCYRWKPGMTGTTGVRGVTGIQGVVGYTGYTGAYGYTEIGV